VRFKAIGNAPIMKQNFYKITSSNRFQAVIQFLRKELGWQAGEPLVSHGCLAESYDMLIYMKFTYINLAFSPAPDDTVSNLFKVQRVLLDPHRDISSMASLFPPMVISSSTTGMGHHLLPQGLILTGSL
jgi:hypothetical protein